MHPRHVAGAEDVDLTTIRPALAERGVDYPSGGKHPSMTRLWLEKAGVFVGSRWQIDDIRLQEVLGTDPAMYRELSRFTTEQRAFLRTLANTGISGPQPANEIVKLAAATYGVRFPEKSLPKLVLNALVAAGYIAATKTTVGRGAKPFIVAPTDKVTADLIEPLFDQLKDRTDPKLIELLRKPLAEVRAELPSDDVNLKGLPLEALAFKLMRLVDMEYMATRLRASATGGAEVDLVFQSARLVYLRWQVQCKNTSRVSAASPRAARRPSKIPQRQSRRKTITASPDPAFCGTGLTASSFHQTVEKSARQVSRVAQREPSRRRAATTRDRCPTQSRQ
jgi:site-specific DNA-methyltransferase (cytosine-N4-specific)